MADFLGRMSAKDVKDSKTFVQYARQQIGIPPLPVAKYPALNKSIKAFFVAYPRANYATLAGLVEFVKTRNMRPKDMFEVLGSYKAAWRAGYLPELDPQQNRDEALQDRLQQAIDIEDHPRWIERLKGAMWQGSDEQAKAVLIQWTEERKAAGMKVPK